MIDLKEINDKLLTLLMQAGDGVLSFYGSDLEVKDKEDDSPVTQADLESNKIIINKLKEFGYPILSEEGVDDDGRFEAEYVWIVDPLDGTRDFIEQTGEFTIMVGLVKKEKEIYRPILGVIYCPVKKTFYYAIKNQGAWKLDEKGNKKQLYVSNKADSKNVTMLTSRHHSSELEKRVADSLGITHITKLGSSLKACLISEQIGDFNFNPSNHTFEWDVCASDIIIHEAGGRFSDINGGVIKYNKKDPKNYNGYLATNKEIYDRIVIEIKNNKNK